MAKYDSETKEKKCIFCEIAKKNLAPLGGGLFWENDKFIAFLSPFPNTKGFTIVMPKKHFDGDVLKMPNKELSEFMSAVKEVSNILIKHLKDVGRIGVIMEGTGINHAHIKLFPMHKTEELRRGEFKQYHSNVKKYFNEYEGYISSHDSERAEDEELQKLARELSTKD